MNSQVITIKVDPTTKKEAQDVAQKLGLSLSAIIKGLLKQFIRTKSITLSTKDEIPSEYLMSAIKKAEKNLKEGKTSPVFDNVKDNLAWLKKQGI